MIKNNNYPDCDGNFKTVWTPPENIAYTITAFFSGTNSYFESYASTSVASVATGGVPTGSTPTPAPVAATDNTLLYIIIAAVVIAIILGLVNIVVISMRKNKQP